MRMHFVLTNLNLVLNRIASNQYIFDQAFNTSFCVWSAPILNATETFWSRLKKHGSLIFSFTVFSFSSLTNNCSIQSLCAGWTIGCWKLTMWTWLIRTGSRWSKPCRAERGWSIWWFAEGSHWEDGLSLRSRSTWLDTKVSLQLQLRNKCNH